MRIGAETTKATKPKLYESDFVSKTISGMMNSVMSDLSMTAGSVRDFATRPPTDIPYIPTGIPTVDAILGIGGIPRKSMVEIYGKPGCGKTYTAEMLLGETTRFGHGLYMDLEGGFNPHRAEQLGVNLNRVQFSNTFESGEIALDFMIRCLYDTAWESKHKDIPHPKIFDLIVLDSVAALASRNMLEADLSKTKGTRGEKLKPGTTALMISQYLPRIYRAVNRSSGIWLNDPQHYVDLVSGDYRELTTKGMSKSTVNEWAALIKKRESLIGDLVLRQDAIGEAFPRSDNPEIKNIEASLGGYVYSMENNNFQSIHYNPGPVIVFINQTRTGGIGSGYTTEERPGGEAYKYFAGTILRMRALTTDANIIDPKTKVLMGHKSEIEIKKSRFAKPFTKAVVVIPFEDTEPDAWMEFLNVCEQQGLYKFIYKKHRIPKDGSVIETPDDLEFYTKLLEGGLEYLCDELGWKGNQLENMMQIVAARLQAMLDEDLTESENTLQQALEDSQPEEETEDAATDEE